MLKCADGYHLEIERGEGGKENRVGDKKTVETKRKTPGGKIA